MKHTVTDIQRFCMHDGPSVRTTVFLKGCPLNCFWCHNPETKKESAQLLFYPSKCIGCGACLACAHGVHCDKDGKHGIDTQKCVACGACTELCPTGALSIAGREMESEEIIELALRDSAFYGEQGGITLSGGEPMLRPEACIELLKLARERGLNTCIETSGYFDEKYVEPLCRACDCILWDVKDTNDERHRENVGVSNERILKNLRLADSFGTPIVLRCVLLKGVNLEEEHLTRVRELYLSMKNAVRVDLLPCHSLGNAKLSAMGQEPVDLARFEPTREDVEGARKILG